MSKAVRAVVACTILIFSAGCVSMVSGLIFSPTAGEINGSGKTIAVVSAINDNMNIAVANSMADALTRNSTFKVVPSNQVTQKIPGYPQNINGPYESADMTIDIDYTKTDREKVKELMKKLKTDYAYVIWVPTGYSRTVTSRRTGATSGQGTTYAAVAQMFRGPEAEVVGQGRFSVTAVRYLPGARNSAKDLEEAVYKTTETISKIVAEKSGTLKR